RGGEVHGSRALWAAGVTNPPIIALQPPRRETFQADGRPARSGRDSRAFQRSASNRMPAIAPEARRTKAAPSAPASKGRRTHANDASAAAGARKRNALSRSRKRRATAALVPAANSTTPAIPVTPGSARNAPAPQAKPAKSRIALMSCEKDLS